MGGAKGPKWEEPKAAPPTFYSTPPIHSSSSMRATIREVLRYLVPRKWLRALTYMCVGLSITGTIILLQEGAIVYIWASSTKYSTQQLEAMIPQESSITVKKGSPHHIISMHHNDTPHNITLCKVVRPQVLFFIRVPKCASTSFINLLRFLAKRSRFQLLFNSGGAYDWSDAEARKEVALIQSKGGKVVYARHFYYIDFTPYGLTNFSFITVIREPTARFLSSYLYYHYSSKRYIQKMLKPEHKNESLLECTMRRHNGCAHNWLTKYFCGHDEVCLDGPKALPRAKHNMRSNFAAVGLLEDIDLTLKVFCRVLPGFFAGGGDFDFPRTNRNERSMVLSTEEKEAVQRANSADIELHSYAKELLQSISTSCH